MFQRVIDNVSSLVCFPAHSVIHVFDFMSLIGTRKEQGYSRSVELKSTASCDTELVDQAESHVLHKIFVLTSVCSYTTFS